MRKIIIASLLLASTTAMAAENYFVGLDLGVSKYNASKGEQISNKIKFPLIGVNAGYQFNKNIAVGVSFNYLPDAKKTITIDANNYNTTSIQSNALLAFGKFNLDTGSAFSPFAKVSLGVARTTGKSEEKKGDVIKRTKITKNRFAYGIDFGVDYALYDNTFVSASLGYLNLGQEDKVNFAAYTAKLGFTYNF